MIKYYIFLFIALILISIVQIILKTLAIEYSGNIFKSLYDPLIPASLITIVISSIVGLFIFNEVISLRKIIAYVLIAIGMITLTYSKTADSSHTVLDKKATINLKDVK